ncbi:MAG: DUF6603 domain-containing protein [Blastocatellia bacterium]
MARPQQTSNDFLQQLVTEISDALRTLSEILSDPLAKREVLADLGLNPNSAATLDISTELDALDVYAGKSDPGLEGFLSAADSIITISNAIEDFIAASRDGTSPAVQQVISSLFSLVGTSFIRHRLPVLYEIARALGFLDETFGTHLAPAFRWEPIGKFLEDTFGYLHQRFETEDEVKTHLASDLAFLPVGVAYLLPEILELTPRALDLYALYGWERDPASVTPIADTVSNRALSLGADLKTGLATSSLAVNFLMIPGSHGGPALLISVGGGVKLEDTSPEGWKITFEASTPAAASFRIGTQQGVTGPSDAKLTIKAERAANAQRTPLIIGDREGTRIEIGKLGFSHTVAAQSVGIKATASQSAVIIKAGDADGFLAQIISAAQLRADFSLGIGLDSEKGVTLEGGTGIRTVIPVARTIGPLTIQYVLLGIAPSAAGVAIEVSVALSVKLGPVAATVEQIGFRLNLTFPDGDKNLGFAHLTLGFKPPKGIGLVIDAGVVTGGGYLFFDPEQDQYAGVVMLKFTKLTLKAIGLLSTRFPDGSSGFSLLIIITIEDFPPIQLGFGFTMTGIGGLLGINRTAMPDVLRAGVKNRTIGAILFPEDPVRNAPQIIAALSAVFPPARGRYTLGLMVQLAWGTPSVVTLELGVILELPSPVRLILLGRIESALPTREAALIEFHLDAVGILDFGAQEASVDASLYDSRVLLYTITGDMALRASWGATSVFALSIGGFHPQFTPPVGFPTLERAAISLGVGNNPRLRASKYWAVTSNTLQMGARVELYAAAMGFSVEGFIGYDLLIKFDPFSFIAEFEAGLSLKRGGSTLMGVHLKGTLAGFSPLWVEGKASFKILFFRVSFKFHFTLIEGDAPPRAAGTNVSALLNAALQDQRNWTPELPPGLDSLVALKKVPATSDVVVHPLAELTVRQTVVPLDLEISQFGNTEPIGARKFTIESARIAGAAENARITPIDENFAPAQYLDLTDDEKLVRPSFESMQAGVRIGTGEMSHGVVIEINLVYEERIVDPASDWRILRGAYTINASLMAAFTLTGAVALSQTVKLGARGYEGPSFAVKVIPPEYVIATTRDLTVQSSAETPRSYSTAHQAMQAMARGGVTNLQLVPIDEGVRR